MLCDRGPGQPSTSSLYCQPERLGPRRLWLQGTVFGIQQRKRWSVRPCSCTASAPARPPKLRKQRSSPQGNQLSDLERAKLSEWLHKQSSSVEADGGKYQDKTQYERPEEQLGKALLALSEGADVGQVLQGHSLEARHITRLLSYVGKYGSSHRALAVFNWLDGQSNYETRDCFIYTRLMSLFGRGSANARVALELFDRMQAANVKPDLIAFNAAISAAGKACEWDRMLRIFSNMNTVRVKPDVYTFTSLIRACQSCGNRWRKAVGFFEQMQRSGVEPNVQAYTALISVCSHAGQFDQALATLHAMDRAGVQPDAVAYNSLMAACAAKAQWEPAWAVMAAMKRCGTPPTVVSFNLLLSACERAGQPDRALEVFARMKREAANANGRLDPCLVSYNTVLSACAKGGLFDRAMQLYEEMQQLQMAPDIFTLTSLINACDQAEKGWQLPVQLAHDFEARGVKLNTVAVNLLMHALGKAGEWEQAMQLFTKMTAPNARPDLQPNLITYSVLIQTCRKAQKYAEAVALYHELSTRRLSPNAHIFHAMLALCKEGGLWQDGLSVVRAMQARRDIESEGLAIAAQEALFANPALRPVASAAQVAIDSGRATRRWIDKR